jgi:L-ascorbate metabolism protein UlaG (beta-lactamase superfamily)
MKIQLIRNATLKLEYAGHTVLIDPYFASKHSLPSYTGRSANPLVKLPVAIDNILDGVELVIVSHLHSDHFDSIAKERVPKQMPILCQRGDEAKIREAGFTDVSVLTDTTIWNGLTLTRREGSHGLGPVVEKMGHVMGFSLSAEGEPSMYWTGDTVLYQPVTDVINETNPDIIVTHSCGARWDDDLIVMDAQQTVSVCQTSKSAIVIATHMEALDHATISRQDLRRAAEARGIPAAKLLIPEDGDVLVLGKT